MSPYILLSKFKDIEVWEITKPSISEWRELTVNQTDEQFREVILKHMLGFWKIIQFRGPVSGVGVIYPDESGTLHIFYLNGGGLWGRVKEVAKALMDISHRWGLRGLSVTTEDFRRVRLYCQSGAKIVDSGPGWWTLELLG